MLEPTKFPWSVIWGVLLTEVASLIGAMAFPNPWNYISIFGIAALAVAFLRSLDLEQAASRRRLRQSEASTEKMHAQLSEIHAARFAKVASSLPIGLKRLALELSSDILSFVVTRQSLLPTAREVYSESKQQGTESQWQKDFGTRLGEVYRESFALWGTDYQKKAEEVYRQIRSHGASDQEMQFALTRYPQKWPDDMYIIGEKLGELAERL